MHWGCYYATALDIEVDPCLLLQYLLLCVFIARPSTKLFAYLVQSCLKSTVGLFWNPPRRGHDFSGLLDHAEGYPSRIHIKKNTSLYSSHQTRKGQHFQAAIKEIHTYHPFKTENFNFRSRTQFAKNTIFLARCFHHSIETTCDCPLDQ